MTELTRLLASPPRPARWLGAVSEDTLQTTETTLGITIPPTYRSFLDTYGGGSIGHIEVLGLGIPATGHPSLLFAVRDLEARGFPTCPVLLPVSPIGDGSWVALILQGTSDHPVGSAVIWDPRRDAALAGVRGTLAPSFEAWLAARLVRLAQPRRRG